MYTCVYRHLSIHITYIYIYNMYMYIHTYVYIYIYVCTYIYNIYIWVWASCLNDLRGRGARSSCTSQTCPRTLEQDGLGENASSPSTNTLEIRYAGPTARFGPCGLRLKQKDLLAKSKGFHHISVLSRHRGWGRCAEPKNSVRKHPYCGPRAAERSQSQCQGPTWISFIWNWPIRGRVPNWPATERRL